MKALLKPASIISAALSVLSILSLVYQGFSFGWSSPLHELLRAYDSLVGVVVTYTGMGWTVRGIAQYLHDHVFPDLHVRSQWRHVFVLMWLYFAADAWTYWRRGRRFSVVFTIVWGGAIAIAASIGFASQDIGAASIAAVAWPCVGFVVYEVGQAALCAVYQRPEEKSWLEALVFFLRSVALTTAIVGLGAFLVGMHAQSRGLPAPSLLALGAFIVALAARNLLLGWWLSLATQAAWYDPLENLHAVDVERRTWGWRFLRSSTSVQGMRIVFVIVGVSIALMFDAGLDFVKAHSIQ